jgi:hypothetical protein
VRHVFRFAFALALGLALMAGCNDENGDGGSGGTAGTGGLGATGGTPECESVEYCDDENECTEDTCNASSSLWENRPVQEGTSCAAAARHSASTDRACARRYAIPRLREAQKTRGTLEVSGAPAWPREAFARAARLSRSRQCTECDRPAVSIAEAFAPIVCSAIEHTLALDADLVIQRAIGVLDAN